jgi:hypothetical protein
MPTVSRLQAARVQGSHPAGPGRVDPALDQRRQRQRIDHREADIAAVEERRMHGQGPVLQQRIERPALDRDVNQAGQRVRGEDGIGQEHHAQRALDGDGVGPQARRQAVAEEGHGRAVPGQHQAPQQHRAFVAAPGPGHLVEHRLGGVGVGGHVGHREVRDHEGMDQGREGHGHGQEGRHRRAASSPGQHRRAPRAADGRQSGLGDRQHQRQDQGEGAQFDDHVVGFP